MTSDDIHEILGSGFFKVEELIHHKAFSLEINTPQIMLGKINNEKIPKKKELVA